MNMKAQVALIMLLIPLTGLQASSFDDAIKNATTSGQFRLGAILVNPDVAGTTNTSASAFGGIIKFETAKWKGMEFAIAPYFSEKLDALSGDQSKNELSLDFSDSSGKSYAYIGEAYINYDFTKGSVRLGRQKLDNPSINTNDIRMHPNTFNAAWFNMNISNTLVLDAGVVTQMAGHDSNGSQDVFTNASNDGVTAVGLTYQMKAHHTFQGWYYDFNDQYSQYYLDAIYQNGPFNAGLQYSKYNEVKNSGTAGSVWGIKANYTFKAMTLGLAINGSTNDVGKSQSLGLGRGHYFTSMDETTIGSLSKASAQVVRLDYSATEQLSVGLAYGQFADRNKTTTDTTEMDASFAYKMNKKLNLEFIHALVDNKAAATDAKTNFSRNLVRVNYLF